ncbi:hypothetical protein AJ79_08097 [Helicocarpus griseus UAMH5409]|uniref:Uncharacterized protein n=1 Tax=Helicocarpus griseus UAMH5409 TaxID=1447875 RepID=A0A2B7WVZ0_9EURO|nr:hypothetical protein AJ79_08097 [Helicocarpus griseus UAMH5409]
MQLPEVSRRFLVYQNPHQGLRNNPPGFTLDSTLCRRQSTVSALWSRLRRYSVIHVRGTPASGKSTLAQLLARHVKKNSDIPVLIASWPLNFPDPIGVYSDYNDLLNFIFKKRQLDNWMGQPRLIIIDEAQSSYPYLSFWNDLIKSITYGCFPYVALFTSYGSPGSEPINYRTPTPIYSLPEQRVSLWPTTANPELGLFFSREEFNDITARVLEHHSQHGQHFLLSEDLKEFVYRMTSGHASAVRCLLDGLALSEEFREFRKTSSPISLDIAMQCFSEDTFILHCIEKFGYATFGRGPPKNEFLRNNASITQFLREIVACRLCEDKPEQNRSLDICYQNGWLHGTLLDDGKVAYVFTTALHRRYLEHVLSINTPPFPKQSYGTLRQFWMAVIPRIEPAALRDSASVEALFQDEFYRACYSLMDRQLYLSSEWTGREKGGRVDFQVRGTDWAIELLRDGNGIDEHISRFEPGGQYYLWMQSKEIQDYAVLDFRTTQPRKKRDNPHLYYVVFTEDYTTYRFYNSRVEQVGDQVALLK